MSLLISFLTGLMLTLAFPRTNLYPVAWLALAPLLYLSVRNGWLTAALCGFAFGLGYFGSLLYWIGVFGTAPWIALTVLQALYTAAFALLARLIAGRLSGWGRLIVLPALWVSFEWIRTLGMFGFTWGDLGYSQTRVLPVVQLASITGVWGVSFAVAAVNAAVANAFGAWVKIRSARASLIHLGAALAIAAVVLGYGLIAVRTPIHGTSMRAAVVQGNIDQDAAEDLDYSDQCKHTYRRMTLDAASAGARLIVWPETSVPGFPGSEPYLQGWLAALAHDAGSSLIVGGRDSDLRGRVYNSAFLVRPGEGIVGRYAKVRLVPFGEFVPLRGRFPALDRVLDTYRVTPIDISPGLGFDVLDGGPCRVGTAICFESIFPYISRELTASGAELLCVITNDTWFEHTPAAEQHAAMSVLRAVENRRYLLRGAATGVSCIIDPKGRVLAESSLFSRESISGDVEILRRKSFYTRHGDWFVCASFVTVGLALVRVRRRRR